MGGDVHVISGMTKPITTSELPPMRPQSRRFAHPQPNSRSIQDETKRPIRACHQRRLNIYHISTTVNKIHQILYAANATKAIRHKSLPIKWFRMNAEKLHNM
jgi:hypothetical protein